MSWSDKRTSGAVLGTVLGWLVAVGLAAFAVYFFYCPCERAPGGWLLGDRVDVPVQDWQFANRQSLCQIQVYRGGVWPHSINLNCMATRDGELYLSCASCEGKAWSTAALAYPEARLRVGEDVYPVMLTRVQDPAVLDRAWQARARKIGRGQDTPREAGWWSFRVESRDPA